MLNKLDDTLTNVFLNSNCLWILDDTKTTRCYHINNEMKILLQQHLKILTQQNSSRFIQLVDIDGVGQITPII